MRVTCEETATMSGSFLMKKYNYRHCPLKKRPIQFIFKEEVFSDPEKDMSDDNSEPENLSTKPEDLSMSCKSSSSPTPAVTPFNIGNSINNNIKKYNEDDRSIGRSYSPVQYTSDSSSYGQHFLAKSTGGPLEPLNLNTSANNRSESPTPVWPRAVPAHYPPHYIPLNYFYPPPPPPEEMYHHYYPSSSPVSITPDQLSPYAPRDPLASPPHRGAFTPFRSRVPVIASLPHCPTPVESVNGYLPPYSHSQSSENSCSSPLSPTSSSSSNSYYRYKNTSSPPPPVSPEDLSSSGSVISTEECVSTDGSKKKSKDTSAPRYKCSFCSKSYSTYSGLSKHQQFHCSANEDSSAKKTFSCKYCEKVYVSLGALKMHIRTHTLPCKCKLCGKAFSRPWLLQGHIRTHTGEKPFSCQHCNRAFADRSNLRAHLQTHSDVKKYSCPTCSKTFSRMSLLSKHNEGGCPGSGPTPTPGVIRINHDIQRQSVYQAC